MCNNSQGYYGDNDCVVLDEELRMVYGLRGGGISEYGQLLSLLTSTQVKFIKVSSDATMTFNGLLWKDKHVFAKRKPYYRQNERW